MAMTATTIAMDERLTTGEAARAAGVSSETIRVWIKAGRLPAERTPLGVLIDAYDLDAAIAARDRRRREQGREPAARPRRTA